MDSRFRHVQVFVQLERGVYEEGSQVNGVIIVQASQMVRASQLRILLKGEEKVQYTKMESNPAYNRLSEEEKTRNPNIPPEIPKHYHNQQPFCNSYHTIATFSDRTIPPGIFQYPFGFKLGQGIPNTFEHFWSQNSFHCEAIISYSLIAQLIGDGTDQSICESIKYITINNPSLGRMEETRKVSKNHMIYNFCCKDNGNLELTTYFEKDWYYVDDDAYIICELDNSHSMLKVNRVSCQLDQNLTCKGNKYDTLEKYTIIPGQSQEVNLSSGKKMTGNNAIRIMLPLAKTTGDRATSTVNGELIGCRHTIKVTLHLEGCCQTSPSNTLGITIFNRMHEQQIASAPMGTPTQVYNPVMFSPQMTYMQHASHDINTQYPTM